VEQAIAMFQKSQDCSEYFLTAIYHHGLMQRRIGEHHNALRSFRKVMSKLPDDKTIHYQRGLVYQDMGNHQLAITDFNMAIRLDPDYAEALFHRASSLRERHFLKEALADYDKSLARATDDRLAR